MIGKRRPNTLVMLALAAASCAVTSSNPVWLDISILTGILSLISLSAGLSYGQAGILSMAQGVFAAIGAYASAIATTRFGLSPFAALVFALALPALMAWSVARAVTWMAPLATALATLALGTLVEIVARNWDDVTGGYIGISGVPPIPGFEKPVVFNILVWGFVCVAVLLYENLMDSAWGRALNIIRHDRTRAIADGVAVAPLLSAMLAFSAAMAGAGGWLYVHYITYMSPQSLDTQTSISVLLMAVVGGADFILGPVIGTLLLNMLGKLLPAQEAQGLFYGGALIVILLVARDGLLGRIGYLLSLLRRKEPAEPKPVPSAVTAPEVAP
ncbi:branched-chain amino acid ABC transporter permease [Bradyrhizobium lablabi]|uniref:branched-chain amino acid ABC transporter permease n=1 Tax=Bradyrhizobium lablabi TaxID=722472 RepID=UPI001BAA45CC|nr:branched-chain amino acid ABC transporter permease [Bradyrhizobium lablabi]